MGTSNNYIFQRTSDDQEINYFDLDPEIVTPERIAGALSRIVRFAGHYKHPLTVAEHSVMCSLVVKARNLNWIAQMYALLHDAGEAYTMDVPGPLKARLHVDAPETGGTGAGLHISRFEEMILRDVYSKLGLTYPCYEIIHAVHQVDKSLTDMERVSFAMGQGYLLMVRSQAAAERMFLSRYKELMREGYSNADETGSVRD